jgi:hypothetical protein
MLCHGEATMLLTAVATTPQFQGDLDEHPASLRRHPRGPDARCTTMGRPVEAHIAARLASDVTRRAWHLSGRARMLQHQLCGKTRIEAATWRLPAFLGQA